MPVSAQHLGAEFVGYLPQAAQSGAQTLQLNAAGTWLALSFVASESKTLSAVEIRTASVAGTLGANDLTCDIYSDVNGIPSVSLASSNTLAVPAAVGVTAQFTGFALALTAGTQYWAVFKNVNGTPAANNVTWRFGLQGTNGAMAPTASNLWGWNKVHTTNSGGAWATGRAADVFGLRLDFSDGTAAGEPVNSANLTASANGVFGSRELGVTFTNPGNAVWNVRGIGMYVGKVGAPPGNVRFRLYQDTTLLATSTVIPPGNIVSGFVLYVFAYFGAAVPIRPGATVRAVIGTDGAGDAANYFNTTEYNIANDPVAEALFPFSLHKSFFDGSAWTDTVTVVTPVALLLDSNGEFA